MRRRSIRWAHPRAGGENWDGIVTVFKTAGSSPRGRGKLRYPTEGRIHHRLIPARAGKTRARGNPTTCVTAHPRAGGENFTYGLYPSMAAGSSPRGRGKPITINATNDSARLIPARAGKTLPRSHRETDVWAHPRAGGENWIYASEKSAGAGSSPRGRGKRGCRRRRPWRVRLIPARAGKTTRTKRRARPRRAHPRAGGENREGAHRIVVAVGSSPRGRGKLIDRDGRTEDQRLIPARAGKTPPSDHGVMWSGAHPRAGGENVTVTDDERRARWLIPARAGKTLISARSPCPVRAHPRAGGENSLLLGGAVHAAGSSPRGRGKPGGVMFDRWCLGLIPARAGKTVCSRSLALTPAAHPRAGGENEMGNTLAGWVMGSSPRGRGKP